MGNSFLEIRVSQKGNGDFNTISEAVLSVPYNVSAKIFVEAGTYLEKVFIDKKHLILCGEGAENTIISWADGGFQPHSDGYKKGTFRSYTVFLEGEQIEVKNITIENTAGDGRIVGQAIACYVDSTKASFENVNFLGCQDTLFCGPLPEKEHEVRGFFGPRYLTERQKSKQHYNNCLIKGDVDFIFGSADAVFKNCEIFSKNRNEEINGYVTAPSSYEDGLGFIFINCKFTSDCEDKTVYLGRPWRAYGKTRLINCELGSHIKDEGWDNWGKAENESTACFGEFGTTATDTTKRVKWSKTLTEDEAIFLIESEN